MNEMQGYEALTEAIRSIPVPGAPPRTSIDGAAVGLSFLDTVLRLNHVRRLTDRLTLVEHRSARRTTEVDIDLGMLDENQRQAAVLFQQLVSQQADAGSPGTVWVPVARIPRKSVSPVDVLDGSGQKLPKLTQYETSRLLASALFQLLRGILAGDPEARQDGDALNRLLYQEHEARWLIQAALQTLLVDRDQPRRRANPAGGESPERDLALSVLENKAELLADYFSLLDIAVNEYLLVVGLDGSTTEHLLTYEAPLHVAAPPHGGPLVKYLRANRRGYFAEYRSTIPVSLRSYHLVVDTEAGVGIETMYLTTDADEALRKEVSADLETLETRLRNRAEPYERRLLTLALDTALHKVAELVRRKKWAAEQAQFDLTPDLIGVAALTQSSAEPGSLRSAARTLEESQVGWDLMMENDPLSARAHAYWRRDGSRSVDGASQIAVRAGMILRDTTAAGPKSVLAYALSIATVSYLMLFLLTGSALPWDPAEWARLAQISHREAVIVVLLLVPGFLYTRLSLPQKYSIAGYLRGLPRFVAHLCIGSMAAVAAAIAADSPGPVVGAFFAASIVLPLAAAVVTIFPVLRGPRRARDLLATGAPQWLHSDRSRKPKRWKPDVVLHSNGANR